MENQFSLKKYLIENKLTTNSKTLKENFAPSPNENLGVEEADYSVEKAFIKAGIDMSKPITVVDHETPPRQEDAKYLAEHIDGERRVYLSDYQEGDDFPVFYEFENNTVIANDIPEGVEYKLTVAFPEVKDYSILQAEEGLANNMQEDMKSEGRGTLHVSMGENAEEEQKVIDIARDAIALMDEQPGTDAVSALEAVLESFQ